jgi:drug/metabolite transporter (DMT)-like permease
VLVLDERFGPTAVAGLVAILAGSWLATRPTSQPRLPTLETNRPPAP